MHNLPIFIARVQILYLWVWSGEPVLYQLLLGQDKVSHNPIQHILRIIVKYDIVQQTLHIV